MYGLRTSPRANCDTGHSCWSWLVVLWLVIGCLTVQRIGGNMLIGSLVRVEHEESTEESKSEVEAREATHKCSRVRVAGHSRDERCQPELSLSDNVVHAPRTAIRLAVHRVGAGIRIRC